jgi:deoxyhypusine monooxygenase
MVRHEAAEALGGIASDGVDAGEDSFDAQGREVVDVLGVLREWAVKGDAPVVVRESCQVAIDMWEVGLFFSSPLLLFSFFIFHLS